jgi:hypothetical protein
MANLLRRTLPRVAAVTLVASFAPVLATHARAQASGSHEILFECQGALWKRTFDEATAAGLNPGATPVTFEARKATTTRRNGKLVAVGTEEYRPTPDVPAFAVRYECVADLVTGKVESVSYAAIRADGTPSSKAPTTIVREARIVNACRAKVDEKVAGTALNQGLSAGGVGVELDAESAALAPSGTTIDVSGRGQIRLSKDYEWQPVTFTCRYEEKKKEATRASYAIDRTAAAAPALSADKSRALESCHAAVEDEVLREAQRRGYRALARVRVDLKPGATFAAVGQDLEVKGSGEYKLDARHREPTPLTFACVYDPRGDAVKSASFEAGESSRTASGEVAGGKTATLICESTSDVQRACPAKIKGNVHIIRQRGRTPCEAYKNWIWSLSGITVWGGCRAEFEFDVP